MIPSIAARNAASVFPDPVGARISVDAPEAIAGQPSCCGRVGASKDAANQSRTGAWKLESSAGVVVTFSGYRDDAGLAEEEGDSPDEDREADEPAHEHGPEEDAVRDAERARGEAGDVEERVQRDGEHEEEQPGTDGLTDKALEADVDGVAGEKVLLNAPDRVR